MYIVWIKSFIGCSWFILWCLLVTDSPKTHPFITSKEQNYISSNQKRSKAEFHAEIGEVEIGGVAIYRPLGNDIRKDHGEFGKTKQVLPRKLSAVTDFTKLSAISLPFNPIWKRTRRKCIECLEESQTTIQNI
ncbi:UNVERIFIED_CONTAM: hypothetical protein NCL1_28454 [Trichonephila clavipes]